VNHERKIIQTTLNGKIVETISNKSLTSIAKPFLKWAGGKGQILHEIENRLPNIIKQNKVIDSYIEPFVGGGAVFFHLMNNYKIKESTLIDNNKELLVGYQVIKQNPNELIKKLTSLEKDYHKKTEDERKEFFYQQRDAYNRQMKIFDYDNYSESWIDRTVYLIFLNRTCFNGLFRQNKSGEFNVPFGRYKNPRICDAENILQVHNSLQNTNIICGDFTDSMEFVREGSLVYFDPPYRPISSTAYFTDYSMDGFNDDEQKRLANYFRVLDKKGAFLILSNSDPKNEDPTDNFFDDLYKGFNIERIKAKRAISCVGSGRGEINELLIRNYPRK